MSMSRGGVLRTNSPVAAIAHISLRDHDLGGSGRPGHWRRRVSPSRSREPVGEGGDEIAELVRSLDDERAVE
jgi:hypothetical protein